MKISVVMIGLIVAVLILAGCTKTASEGVPTPPAAPGGEGSAEEKDVVGQAVGADCSFANLRDNTVANRPVKSGCEAVADVNVVNTKVNTEAPYKEVLFYPAGTTAPAGDELKTDMLNVDVPKPTGAANEVFYMFKKGYVYHKRAALGGDWLEFDWNFGSLTPLEGGNWYKISDSTNTVAAKYTRQLTPADYDIPDAEGGYVNWVVAWICKCNTAQKNCNYRTNWDCNGQNLGVANGKWILQYFVVSKAITEQGVDAPTVVPG